jgi:hypothetical protein
MFPGIRYIYWISDPRDCIIGPHLTDDLRNFGVDYQLTENERLRRAISWKYQYDLVKATPKPKHWIEVRFEDFVLHQDKTLKRLEAFLGIKLVKIPVISEAVNRWKINPANDGINHYELFRPAMLEYGYELP